MNDNILNIRINELEKKISEMEENILKLKSNIIKVEDIIEYNYYNPLKENKTQTNNIIYKNFQEVEKSANIFFNKLRDLQNEYGAKINFYNENKISCFDIEFQYYDEKNKIKTYGLKPLLFDDMLK
jgi:uncharacterized protein (DUF342 family)